MKNKLVLAILVFVCGLTLNAMDNEMGIGIILGEPTGVSLKKWIDSNRAVDGALAWSLSDGDSVHLHADYLFHKYDVFSNGQTLSQLPVYFGIGTRVKFKEHKNDDDVFVGVRFPVGISYLFSEVPFDIFLEVVPILDVAPDTDVDLEAAIGGRFYFK